MSGSSNTTVATSSLTLNQFLRKYEITKDTPQTRRTITLTEVSKYKKAKYHIPAEEQDNFVKLFYSEYIKTGKHHHLIERQLTEKGTASGVLLCDIDFRFAADCTDRIYTKQDVLELVRMYLEAIEETCEMDEDVRIITMISEKPNPRVEIKDSGNVVKDGIHLMINLEFSREHQVLLRNIVLKKIEERWSHLPIVNTGGWNDVVDDVIPSGQNGWLLPNCKKENDTIMYDLTHVYEAYYDVENETWINDPILTADNRTTIMKKYYKLLFPRHTDRPSLVAKTSVLSELDKVKEKFNNRNGLMNSPSSVAAASVAGSNDVAAMFRMREDITITSQMVLSIRNQEDLDGCVEMFLQSLSLTDYDFKEARDLVKTLPETYYGAGSYNKWIKTGFTLHNISTKLLIVWVEFSAQSSTFQFSDIPSICDTWFKFAHKADMGGLTKRSLVYWAKQENPEGFAKVLESSIDYHIDLTIDSSALQDIANPGKKSGNGCSDWDLALVLYIIKKDDYVCASVSKRVWYSYHDHKWWKNDSGTSLRSYISTGMRTIYYNKAIKTHNEAQKYEPDTEDHKRLHARATKILDISMKLGATTDKDKIMKEAMELFHDDTFLEKLDQNKYLFCCKNGVLDFQEGVFRCGKPEDYISTATDREYHALDETKHAKKIGEIDQYIRSLFPIAELEDYAWRHMASFLIGDVIKTQCLHYWTGIGSNGKSLLVTLLRLVFGKYVGDLDANFYTSERPKRGVSTPELVAIMGKRLAVTSEISDNDRMNEGPMKQLTSGTDIISCRPLYGELMEFVPQCHPIIMANKFIEVGSRDHGTWRRIRVLPFLSLFTRKIDPSDTDNPYQFPIVDGLEQRFEEWADIFFAKLVKIAFETKGHVEMCDLVKYHSEKYQKEQDFILEFISDRLQKAPKDVFLQKSNASSEFTSWLKTAHPSKRNKNKEFCEYMSKMFGEIKKKGSSDGWYGVTYKSEAIEEDPSGNSTYYGDEDDDDNDDDTEINVSLHGNL